MGKDLKKEITNQELLDSVNRSFSNLEKKISTKDEMRDFRNEMETRLDRIENILIAGHDRRIEKIEDDLRLIKTKLAFQS